MSARQVGAVIVVTACMVLALLLTVAPVETSGPVVVPTTYGPPR